MNVVSVTLAGPPGVYRVLHGLQGLAGSLHRENESEPEWESIERSRTRSAQVIRESLGAAVDSALTDSILGGVWIRLQSSPPFPGWREYIAELRGDKAPSNQGVVGSFRPAFSRNGLRFRSRTEQVLAEAFSRSGVLFFPLPAAVSKVQKYEPDFLVCHRGKWGILEVHGDDFHPPETAAKEHERGRWFQELGVKMFQVFNATDCYNDSDGVVERFLKLLAAS